MAGCPLHAGRASAPKATAGVPFPWLVSPAAGTPWHSRQAIGVDRQVVPVRCFAWVPTPRAVVALAALPCASTAFAFDPGAARTSVLATPFAVRSPWHCVQP